VLQSTRVLDPLREHFRYLHYSLSTEQAYLYWVRFLGGLTDSCSGRAGLSATGRLLPFKFVPNISHRFLQTCDRMGVGMRSAAEL
jgi:hypothetical protein